MSILHFTTEVWFWENFKNSGSWVFKMSHHKWCDGEQPLKCVFLAKCVDP
jgi:hypothetical protein